MRLWKNRVLSAAAFAIMAVSVWATPPYGDPNQPYDKIPGTWETDHVKWAKPLAGGKLKVLFILPYPTARDVVELAQRFDMDYTVIMTAGRASWDQGWYEGANATPLFGAQAATVLDTLSKKRLSLANDYDAIVLGNVSWRVVPEFTRDLLLQHVARGAGLVYISPNRQALMRWGNIGGGPGAVADKITAGEDPQFTALFQKNEDPAVATRIFGTLPLDCLPLKVLAQVADFKALKPLPPGGVRAQNPVCITTSSHGKGRVLGLHYFDAELNKSNNLTSLVPNVPYDRLSYDYLYALLAKSVLWSAGREPSVNIGIDIQGPATDLQAPKEEKLAKYRWEEKTPSAVFARNDPSKFKVGLSVELVKGSSQAAVLNWRLQNSQGECLKEENLSVGLQGGKREVKDIALPKLGRGDYFVGFRALDADQRVLDFALKSFRVEDPLRIQKIEMDKDAYQPGEVIRGKVSFSQPLSADQKATVMAIDTWGRIVKRGEVSTNKDKTGGEFSVPVELPLSRLWDVVCEVSDSKGVIDSAKTWVGLPDWNFNEYLCSEWLGPVPGLDYKGRCLTASMRRFGQNAGVSELIYGSIDQFKLFERAGISNVYYAEHLGQRHLEPSFGGQADFNKEVSGSCLSEYSRMARCIADTGKFPDPKEYQYNSDGKQGWMNAQWFNGNVENRYRASAKFGSPFYILNSENTLCGEGSGRENSCFCPLCTSKFQEWCKKAYGDDIRKLNEEWGSDLKNFDEVRGILIKDAVEKNQLPRWVDFRYFMRSKVFTQFHIDWTDMIRRYAPQAKTAMGACSNFDFTRLRTDMTCNSACGAGDMGSVQMELQQSFSGDTSYILGEGNTLRWDPEFQTPTANARYPWKYLFLGCKGLKIGTEGLGSDCLGGHSYLTADYSEPLPFFKNISDEVKLLQRGAGTMVLTATPIRSKVAILWSPYNHYISRLFPFQDNGFSGGSHANVSVGGGAIEDCLMLMQSLRIRPTFVGPQDIESGELEKKGYKALMLPYSRGVSVAEAEAIKKFVSAGGLVIADNEPGTCTEHGRALKDGRLKDLFPVMNKKNIFKYGKGQSLYLAGELNGYAARLARCDYTGSDSVAIALKEYAGIKPVVELVNGKGLPRRDTLMGLFSQGSATIVGLLRKQESEGKEISDTTMLLQQPYHIWDMREKRYCGFANRLEINLDLYPKCYALLPSNPSQIKLELDKPSVKQGETLTVKGEVKFEGDKDIDSMGQVVHVEVLDPELQAKECYSRNVVFKGKSFLVKLPVSYSESPGRYTVVLEHAITGIKAETCFDVEGK
jgi:hypothetical protein